MKTELFDALYKKALGNEITTINEEYIENDKGEMVLAKKTQKTTKNDIDTQALLKLIELEQIKEDKQLQELKDMSEEELRLYAYQIALQVIEEEQARRAKCSKRNRTKK